MADLQIAMVQQASSLEPAENRRLLEATLASVDVPDIPELVVFPEAFQRDFGAPGSDIHTFAEDLDGPFVQAATALARQRGTTVVAGMFERSPDPERPYNTLVVVDEDGLRASYRKIHLYDSFGYRESDRLSAGAVEPVLIDVAGFRVGLMTCYDLRFPELARRLSEERADLVVVPAAWVAGPGKAYHWKTLATARAIENTAYVAALGQPGPRYTGHSLVVSPTGEVCVEAGGEEDTVLTTSVRRSVIEQARDQNPSLANRRF